MVRLILWRYHIRCVLERLELKYRQTIEEMKRRRSQLTSFKRAGTQTRRGSNTEHFLFKPIDALWQDVIAAKLHLKIRHHHRFQKCGTQLETPDSTTNIIGDGNCFFRSISYAITGSQDDHDILRVMISSYITTLETDILGYQTENIDLLRTWATDKELLATALFLKTDIFVYCLYGNEWKWGKFTGKTIQENMVPYERNIYLVNTNEIHFDFVKSVFSTSIPSTGQVELKRINNNISDYEYIHMVVIPDSTNNKECNTDVLKDIANSQIFSRTCIDEPTDEYSDRTSYKRKCKKK